MLDQLDLCPISTEIIKGFTHLSCVCSCERDYIVFYALGSLIMKPQRAEFALALQDARNSV
ncbi:MAG: hypothetical protein CMQ45_05410 [Gammaproteobacteria bacterium]|nr:hypothetical protein [Gammaproteobacteria bacterium]